MSLIDTSYASFGSAVSGSGQTVGATSVDLVTLMFPIRTVCLLEFFLVGYEIFTENGIVHKALRGYKKTEDSVGALLDSAITNVVQYTDGATVGAIGSIVVVSNNPVLRATGVGGRTINWVGSMSVVRVSS